uniref:VapB-type antitoxin n=1 Tax=Ignisphaera aggregans TaxID=334771 RepID=A0A7J2U1Q6_9CREN
MSVTVSIKVRREVVELADKMVRLGLAKSKSHAFNIMIERGLKEVLKEVKFWENIYGEVEELKKQGFVLRHGGLTKLLEEDRSG